jgi:hypothetical protein
MAALDATTLPVKHAPNTMPFTIQMDLVLNALRENIQMELPAKIAQAIANAALLHLQLLAPPVFRMQF